MALHHFNGTTWSSAWNPATQRIFVKEGEAWFQAGRLWVYTAANGWQDVLSLPPNPPTMTAMASIAENTSASSRWSNTRLQWTAPSNGGPVTGYEITFNAWDSAGSSITSTSVTSVGSATTFMDFPVSADTKYSWEVRALGLAGVAKSAPAVVRWETGHPQGTMQQANYGWGGLGGWTSASAYLGSAASEVAVRPGYEAYRGADAVEGSVWQSDYYVAATQFATVWVGATSYNPHLVIRTNRRLRVDGVQISYIPVVGTNNNFGVASRGDQTFRIKDGAGTIFGVQQQVWSNDNLAGLPHATTVRAYWGSGGGAALTPMEMDPATDKHMSIQVMLMPTTEGWGASQVPPVCRATIGEVYFQAREWVIVSYSTVNNPAVPPVENKVW